MKKIIALLLAALTAFSVFAFTACSESATGTNADPADGGKTSYTVGICQLIKHEALDAATQGFKDALNAKLPGAVTFDEQNAAGDSNTCTTIVNSFVSKKVDLIMANATPALQAAYNATEEIPILGTSITEYGVALGIENFNGTVGTNVSGTSDLAPLADQAAMILELFPETKKVGLLYCSGEPNSVYQVKVVEEELAKKGVTCTKYTFSDSNDVAAVTTSAAAASDVIYIPTDNTAANSAAIIGNIVKEAKVPVIAGEEGICKQCGIASLSISYYDLGYKTGEMAAKILKGEADVKEMAIEYAEAKKVYNKEFAEFYGVTIPEGYEAIAD